MKTLILAVLLLAACGPQWEDREGWVQTGEAPAGVDEVLEAARALAPCRIEPWGGWIEWHAEPMTCDGRAGATGCFTDGSARVAATGLPLHTDALDSALPHELGHYVNVRCSGDHSEASAWAFDRAVRGWLKEHGRL